MRKNTVGNGLTRMKALRILCNFGRKNGDFLLVDAASAHTLMEVARHAEPRPRPSAAVVVARNALLIVDRLLSDSSLERGFRTAIEAERDRLQKSLTAMGQRYSSGE